MSTEEKSNGDFQKKWKGWFLQIKTLVKKKKKGFNKFSASKPKSGILSLIPNLGMIEGAHKISVFVFFLLMEPVTSS